MGDDDVYRELQKHLDQMPVGFPATKSGVEIRILKHIFTPEEAKIATKLNWEYEPLETIYSRFDKTEMSIVELKEKLESMTEKGGIHYKKEDDKKYYANAFLMCGMYEYQVERLTKEFVEDFKQYGVEGFGFELFRTGISQVRIIPLESSLPSESYVATYDNLRKIIESMDGPFGVAECLCRKGMDLMGQPCKATSLRENCIMLGRQAVLFIDQGWARSVNKEEALEILRKNEDAGLVLQLKNAQRPDWICSCCGCCCGWLSALKVFPRPVDFFNTNHYAWVDPELCEGCETCIERCQMDALKIVDEVSTVDLGRCIGCGNCVAICPSEAITLKKKEKVRVPPETTDDLFMKIKSRKDKMV